MVHTIKFSYPYKKLMLGGELRKYARLLLVQQVKIQDLSAEFIEYDTDGGKYPLPKRGNYILLTFLKPASDGGLHLFTTLRPDTPGKKAFYDEKIGQLFEVVLTEFVNAQ